ncbi:MAG TPA: NADP-dependent oxidoreductase [Acidimicrobiales bacterium]|jgi:NADPH2:quinone reductase|nr:NADP-dependent oxidoreductase [Acidimicrobiales bacterium]
MRAIGIMAFGGPDVLEVVELPDPVAGPGEVGIRVHAATVNPTDTVLRSGGRAERLRDIAPPHVPGMEAAGILDQIGDGVDARLRLGDRVMAIVLPLGHHGAYAERVVVPVESVVRAPVGSTHAEAATLPMNGLTVRRALDALALEPGQTLAVTGAAGSVGGYAVQMGRVGGLRIVADAAPADEDLVRALGAEVIVHRGNDFAAEVRSVLPDGADALIDTALLDARAVGAVREGGAVVTLRGYDPPGHRGITFHPIYVRHYAREQAKLEQLRLLAEAGALTMRVARTLTADRAPEAHRLLESGGVRGRLVLQF